MKQLLLYLLFLPGLALAQKAAPPSVIIGQPALDARQDSLLAAAQAKLNTIPTSASQVGAVSTSTYATDKSANDAKNTTQDGLIAGNTTAIATANALLLKKISYETAADRTAMLAVPTIANTLIKITCLVDSKYGNGVTEYNLYPNGDRYLVSFLTVKDN